MTALGDAHDDESNDGPKHVEVRWDDGHVSSLIGALLRSLTQEQKTERT